LKPAAALNMMNAGIPKAHQPFWKHMTVEKLYSLYTTLSVSTAKVLSLLSEPVMESASQEEVWHYLRRFVGNMTVDELRTFLCFITRSFIISVSLAISPSAVTPHTKARTRTRHKPQLTSYLLKIQFLISQDTD